MKKAGKSGLGHLKKVQRKNQKELANRFRLALVAAARSKKAECKDRAWGAVGSRSDHSVA